MDAAGKLRIAGAALNQTPLDWQNNLHNIHQAIETAVENHVDILCLPELCITGYGCEDIFLSDWVYQKSEQLLLEVAQWCDTITVVIGLPLKHDGQSFNCSALVSGKQIVGIYAKQNLANDGVHYEPRWFTPWPVDKASNIKLNGIEYPIGDILFKHKGIKIGFEICEDAWRQDRPACRLYEKGVELIINPSASHFAFGKTEDREELIIKSSENFNCTYLYANLLGNEAGRMIYDGEVLIARYGKLIQRNEWLSFQGVDLVHTDIDFSNVAEEYPAPASFVRDKNHEFTQAGALALFDYLRKSKTNGFVLSLSGGADSSSIAILVSEMVKRGVNELGVDKFIDRLGVKAVGKFKGHGQNMAVIKAIVAQLLTCAYQGTKNSSEATFNSAACLADDIGATFYSWKIDDEVQSYSNKIENVLERKLDWLSDDLALQNIQARSRSPIIWMLANIKGALLLTTSNRSEGDLGYTTMDGDTSGSIAPIAAVDKSFIIQWLKWAEESLGYSSLNNVNNLKPSAELRPLTSTQTDEDDLMPYAVIVEIEKLAIRDHKSPLEVFDILYQRGLESKELLKNHITKFFRLWAQNQWKRERIAPAFHLDDFNVDPRTWCRFPILSSAFSEELELLKKR
ncbi:NAD(+) synthase [Fulvivirga sp. M361]|uniref:NAD(+) synthase n=1 Tax=Fulvivirga sp. M361 TaxID=2594266 RepID=UPI00117A8861|nr:NAD(+) synthase [Fulvivirga sp. M361]TRX62193.1 NAD(+) synthase [Fulvivirga sp. M361]